jgi:hypothetical protein
MNMRGHIKLFVLQMNPDKCRQIKDAAKSENICFDLRLNEASSLQRIASPPLVVSARQ